MTDRPWLTLAQWTAEGGNPETLIGSTVKFLTHMGDGTEEGQGIIQSFDNNGLVFLDVNGKPVQRWPNQVFPGT